MPKQRIVEDLTNMEKLSETLTGDMLDYYRERIRVLESRVKELEAELHAYGIAAKHVDAMRDVRS